MFQSHTTCSRDEYLESQADTLLRSSDRGGEFPAYTESQMRRHGKNHHKTYINAAMAEVLVDTRGIQSGAEEIQFVASIVSLSPIELVCLKAWLLGLTQLETSIACQREFPTLCQQAVSRHLRRAQEKCLEAIDVSFNSVSNKRPYHKPLNLTQSWKSGVCRRCDESFISYLGAGCYCSETCRNSSQQSRR